MDQTRRTFDRRIITTASINVAVAGALAIALSGCNLNTEHGSTAGPAQSSNNVATTINVPVTIDIVSLERPIAAPDNVTVSIEAMPANGSVEILSDNRIIYTPNSDYYGQDSFVYKLSDPQGPFAMGTVAVGITCDYCTHPDQFVKLSWNRAQDSSLIYMVYFGDSATTATNIASETREAEVQLNISTDLGATSGDTLCFRLRARNDSGMSGFSGPVCMVV